MKLRASLVFVVACSLGFGFVTAPPVQARRAAPYVQPQQIDNVSDIFDLIGRWTENGALPKIEKILKYGYKVNTVSSDSMHGYNETPLTAAIRAVAPNQSFAADVRPNRFDVVSLMLQFGADVTEPNGNGETPLHVAAAKGDVAIVEELLKRGADINAVWDRSGYKQTPLRASIPFGINAFHILMDKGAKYDAAEILEDILRYVHSEHDAFLETFLSYPVDIPASFSQRLESDERDNDTAKARAAGVIRKQIEANAAKKAPSPLFKRQPVVTSQIVPPLEDAEIVAAVRADKLDAVEKLVTAGADVNAVSRVQRAGDDYKDAATFAAPVLQLALIRQYSDIAAFLIDHGADVNRSDARGDTPLIIALRLKNLDMVKKLVEKGAAVDGVELNYRATPLEVAQSLDIMQYLIGKGADVNHVANYGSVMHDHVSAKDREAVKLLASSKGDINLLNADLETPLQALLKSDYDKKLDMDYVKFIVSLGADLKVKNKSGFTAYDIAMQMGRKDIAEYLSGAGAESGDPAKVLGEALYRGDADAVKQVLDKGFDVHDAKYAFAALGFETKPSTLAVLKLLADHGTDLTGSDSGRQGASLLHLTSDPDIIDFLASKGLDVNAVSGDGRSTPLHVMARAGKPKAVAALLRNKAFPNAVNSEGAGPLCVALMGPQDQRPADGPAIDWPKDATPFLETIKLLMQAGADPSLKDARDCAPWGKDDGYADFRKKAEDIIRENQTAIATKETLAVQKNFAHVPDSDVLYLFNMPGTRAVNRKAAAQKDACDIPVVEAAKQLYTENKDVAPDFKTFLDQLTLKTLPSSVNYNGVNLYPDWQFRGYNLLHLAAYHGDLKLVSALLDEGMDPKATDAAGNTAIYYATHGQGPDLDDVKAIISRLITLGVDINAVNKDNNPALITSSFMTWKPGQPTLHYQLVKFLMANGADPKVNKDGNFNLADVAQNAYKSSIQYKRDQNAIEYKELLDSLAAQGVTPRTGVPDNGAAREKLLNDPLMKGIIYEGASLDKVKAALAAGEDINQRFRGTSPIFASVDRGDTTYDITKYLIEKGAKLDASAGYEPLLARATLQEAHEKTVRLLIEKGAKMPPTGLLETHSLTRGYLNPGAQKALQMILDTGVDPNVCGPNGESPLSKAVDAGNLEAVEILVKNGATPGFCGKNLMLEAGKRLNPQIMAVLLQAKPSDHPSAIPAMAAVLEATPDCSAKP